MDAVVLLVGINDLSLRLERGLGLRPRALRVADDGAGAAQPGVPHLPGRTARRGVVGGDSDSDACGAWRRARRPSAPERPVMIQDECGGFLIDARRNRREAAAAAGVARPRGRARRVSPQPGADRRPGVGAGGAADPDDPALSVAAAISARASAALLVFGRGEGGYYEVEDLQNGLRAYNDVVRELARRRGFTLVDLARQLPKDTTVFCDDVHFNESGARQVADLLAARSCARCRPLPRAAGEDQRPGEGTRRRGRGGRAVRLGDRGTPARSRSARCRGRARRMRAGIAASARPRRSRVPCRGPRPTASGEGRIPGVAQHLVARSRTAAGRHRRGSCPAIARRPR